MIDFRDSMGEFFIPEDLLKAAEAYVPPKDTSFQSQPEYQDLPVDWVVVRIFASTSNAKVSHKVEQKGREFRCSCQAFKIQKRGFCKHTTQTKRELKID